MKYRDLIRQPLPVATFTFLVIVAATFARVLLLEQFSGTAPVVTAPLGRYTAMLRESHPTIAIVVSMLLVLRAGFLIGRNTIRAELYAKRCYLAMPLFGITGCALILSNDFLTQSIAVLLVVIASRNFYNSFHRHYCFDRMFRGALCIGILPFVYAPGAGLWLLVPLVILLFRRTLREAIVAFAGLLLPLFFVCYGYWAFDYGFITPIQQIIEATMTPSSYLFFNETDMQSLAAWAMILFLLLCAMAAIWIDFFQMRTKQRNILLYNFYLICIVGGIYALPGSTAITPALAASALATLLPVALTKFNDLAASIFYTVILTLSLSVGLL